MKHKIYITGLGIVSSLGFGVEENLSALLNCRSGISPISYLDTHHRGKLLAGEVRATNDEICHKIGITNRAYYSRTCLLGLFAAHEAYNRAQLDLHPELRTGLVSSTSVGGIDQSEEFYRRYRNNQDVAPLKMILSHDCGESTERIANYLQVNDFVTTISTACSSSANAIFFGARLLQNNHLDRVIVGGTDALTKYTLNGFNALRILDDQYCKPFDQNRNGLNLGEGAAFLVLETEKAIQKQKKDPIATLAGYGNANDAFHQTASSPDGKGARNAMQMALEIGGLRMRDIDYINAHGTATRNNDLSEGMAIKSIFRDYIPRFSSSKSYTGHTLAAAGAIEAIFSILSLQNNFIIPNLNFTNPIEELALSPVNQLETGVAINNILSNSFGFGGNCSAIVFSKS